MKRNQSGFTLIEIAIVLVIIGLLLGGVLKGQELINSAKVKNLATDFRNIPVYIYGYQDKFHAIPGDDATIGTANTHLTGATPCTGAPTVTAGKCAVGNGIIDGNWNDTTAASESWVFWQHVRLAGLTAGSTDTTLAPALYLPQNASGGSIGIQSGTSDTAKTPMNAGPGATNPIRGTYIICSPNILGKFAKQLDIQLDDGNTATGSMMSFDTSTGSYTQGVTATATSSINDSDTVTVCMGV
jgi:prepilin-type N-terminal cleavage/methylation domain-containing protein